MSAPRPFLALLVLIPVLAGRTTAAEASVDKSGFTLASPTPAALRRDFTTDRPDATESPFTVDAGHLQIEADVASRTRDRTDGDRATAWAVGDFNLRIGLLNQLEAGVFVTPYLNSREEPAGGGATRRTGFGDTGLRLKYNFWGNDGGDTAAGLVVDVSLPTARHGLGAGRAGGDLLLPFAMELGAGWDLGAMTGAEFRPEARPGAYAVAWINTVTVGHALSRRLSGYAEVTAATGDGPAEMTLDAGVAWLLDANTQWDAGANVGLTPAADDLVVFTGLSRRF